MFDRPNTPWEVAGVVIGAAAVNADALALEAGGEMDGGEFGVHGAEGFVFHERESGLRALIQQIQVAVKLIQRFADEGGVGRVAELQDSVFI